MLPDRKTATGPAHQWTPPVAASEYQTDRQVREIQPLHREDHLLISSTLPNSYLPAVISLMAQMRDASPAHGRSSIPDFVCNSTRYQYPGENSKKKLWAPECAVEHVY